MTTAKAPTKIDTRIAQFVALRDKIKEMDKAHKEKMGPARETLDTLSGLLLDHLKSIGGDSVSTPHGTVYRTVKNSATLADGEAFWSYVVDNEAWDMVDKKANVVAVADYIEEHNAPPPGVNYTSMFTVGVRRK